MGSYKYVITVLVLGLLVVWLAVFSFPSPKLHLVTCDVGQGDASLIIYGNFEILIDGGPDNKVLECLGRHLPFTDRTLEVVVLTHPEKDHYGGLLEVFKRYRVEKFIANSLNSGSPNYEVLVNLVGGGGTQVINPRNGLAIRYGLLQLDILYPNDQSYLADSGKNAGQVLGIYTTNWSPNEFSIVTKLALGDFQAFFPGDLDSQNLDLLTVSGRLEDVNYIKVPHHGSRTGMTLRALTVLRPEIAVISAGKNNRFGHPHPEILEMLGNAKSQILRTDIVGDIEIITDGEKWWIKTD